MADLTVLPVAVPLLAAAFLMGAQPILHRRLIDASAIATAAAVAILCAGLAIASTGGPIVAWAGGWAPREGVAPGIAFVVDPIGAGLATLAAILATASFVFSWRYFKAARALFHGLMLVFLAGMTGFCLTGDLFNMFVFFELMSVAAYALTGYKIEEEKSLEGALNFAVVNSVGAFLILLGIGLLYGRTGALNLAQIGRELATAPADGLVVASFVLIVSGLAVKGAIVPFHFWLADAHAVAPAPVCALFSGVMVEMGLYGIARLCWTAYAGPLATHRGSVGGVFLAVGAASAILGGVMSPAQRHIKRLLAFSTISHMGMLLMALGLMDASAIAGASTYVVAHGAIKGALFLLAGILLHALGSLDEIELRGRGRRLPIAGATFALGALGLAGVPPFGTGMGKSWIEEAGRRSGHDWIAIPMIVASALTAGAVLRVACRVFLGWGPRRDNGGDATRGDERRETRPDGGRLPWMMLAPAAVLLVLATLPAWPASTLDLAARRFTGSDAYRGLVLDGAPIVDDRAGPAEGPTRPPIGPTILTAALAAAVAIGTLFADRLPRPVAGVGRTLFRPLRAIHSGKVGDYVAWLTLGVAAFGATLAYLTGILSHRP